MDSWMIRAVKGRSHATASAGQLCESAYSFDKELPVAFATQILAPPDPTHEQTVPSSQVVMVEPVLACPSVTTSPRESE
jgi:hypothetical protein